MGKAPGGQMQGGETTSQGGFPVDGLEIDTIGNFGKARINGRRAGYHEGTAINHDGSLCAGRCVSADRNDEIRIHDTRYDDFARGIHDACRDGYFDISPDGFDLTVLDQNGCLFKRSSLRDRLDSRVGYGKYTLGQ